MCYYPRTSPPPPFLPKINLSFVTEVASYLIKMLPNEIHVLNLSGIETEIWKAHMIHNWLFPSLVCETDPDIDSFKHKEKVGRFPQKRVGRQFFFLSWRAFTLFQLFLKVHKMKKKSRKFKLFYKQIYWGPVTLAMERVPYSYTLNDFPKSSERITSVLRPCIDCIVLRKISLMPKLGIRSNKYLEIYIAVPFPTFQFS